MPPAVQVLAHGDTDPETQDQVNAARRWAEVRAGTTGYDAPIILERALSAALAVRDGTAAYERDTVLFDVPAHRWQMLACVGCVAAAKTGRLHVLDIGGSLASVYQQHRSFFCTFLDLDWSIVEQPHIAAAGRVHLQDGRLRFFDNVDSAEAFRPIDMVLFLSSLQYMPDPYQTLQRAARTGASYMIIDRIPFSQALEDTVIVQQVPEAIYPATYPCWQLSEAKLLRHLWEELGFREQARYIDGIDGDDHTGLFLEKKSVKLS